MSDTSPTTDDLIELSSEQSDLGDTVSHRFRLRAPPELKYFEGHFEGEPILAAVVQLDVVILPRIERLWPDLGPMERATKVKFRSPIRAGDEVTLQLSRSRDRKSVQIAILKDDVECASGSLSFR